MFEDGQNTKNSSICIADDKENRPAEAATISRILDQKYPIPSPWENIERHPFSLQKQYANESIISHGNKEIDFILRPEVINSEVLVAIVQGYYENKEADALLNCARGGEKILELGGGLGFISAVAKKFTNPAHYDLVEANPELIPIIQETHLQNNIADVHVHHKILTSNAEQIDRGFVEFKLAKTFWGSSVKEIGGAVKTVRVDVEPLQTYFDKYQYDLLIANIEWGEIDLFGGLHAPSLKTVIMELHPKVLSEDEIAQIMSDLKRIGLSLDEGESRGNLAVFKSKK